MVSLSQTLSSNPLNLTQLMCLYIVLHCNYSSVSPFNQNEVLTPLWHCSMHRPSITHQFCQWSIPQDPRFYPQSNWAKIMISWLFMIVLISQLVAPQRFFSPLKLSFFTQMTLLSASYEIRLCSYILSYTALDQETPYWQTKRKEKSE